MCNRSGDDESSSLSKNIPATLSRLILSNMPSGIPGDELRLVADESRLPLASVIETKKKIMYAVLTCLC